MSEQEKLPPPIVDGAYLPPAQPAQSSGSPASTVVGSNGSDEKGSDEKAAYKEEKAFDDEEADRIKRQNSKVDVEGAEQQFAAIRRQLSEASAIRRRTTKGSSVSDQDNEELGINDDFDLLAYMRSQEAARVDAGFAHKELGVTFKDLQVIGMGGFKINVRRFPDAIKEFLMQPLIMVMMRMEKFKPKPKMILHKFDGYAKPGEMVLVLGRPGSGCSSFLKAIANERQSFLDVKGDVQYNGIDAVEFKKKYRGEVAYNPENDDHHATLTVAQTILFALSLKTPQKRLPGETQKGFQETVLAMLLKMLNIEHTEKTVVGNAFVRGVSGGERKRVSIAEMMTTRACLLSWDNSSRGLDASTALDYAKSIRIMTDVFRTTTFVSLYQAGEGIWDQFDKVMVIDNGRQIYYGPRAEARQYFINLGFRDLPRQTSADYVTGCTDENERQFADGRNAENTPSTPEKLEEAYRASPIYAKVIAERDAYAADQAAQEKQREELARAKAEDRRKGVPKNSVYTVSFPTQVLAITKRQIALKLQDRTALIVNFVTAVIIAIITGTCYFEMPQSAAGAFTRGGVLFIALLFNAFGAFNELPTQMMGRPIMWRQCGYAFYRPAALSVGSTLADVPFNSFQILVFSVIIYLMSGLVRNAGAFFTFYALVYAGFLALASFFRLLGCLCKSYDLAARLAAFIVTIMVLYSGYVIPVFSMKRWLFWLYYLNPLNYGFAALMENEFGRIDLECSDAYIVPRGASYQAGLGPNQVCTLPGATPGNPVVPGADYIFAGYEYRTSEIWRNFGISLLFFAAFLFLQGLCLETLSHGQNMPAISFFERENKERKALNEKLAENKQAYRKGEREQDLSGLIQTRKPFTWEGLNYDVPVSGGRKQLLNDVFGYVKPGTLTALMGASGAGKTTLLDVLASRKNVGVIGGNVLMNGRKIGRDFQRGTAYAEQLDEHEYTATVREALRFSAYLRQPAHVSKEEKDAYCEEVIQLLEMEDIADAMIGFPGFGLSPEARKRLTIGVELASKPQLLLFLDEPTSGLDGQSAYNLVRFLRKLAAAGQAILCTIHQPNALLFEMFDRLLLLKRGGRTVYFGPIGRDSQQIRDYFAAHGAHCPPDANPAEYMLEAIGAGSQRRVGNKDWADIWAESKELETTKREITEINKLALETAEDKTPEMELEFATPFMTQVKIVSRRTLTAFWRQPDYGFTRLFVHIIVGLMTSLTFLQLRNGLVELQYKIFAIFIATILPAIVITTVEPVFIMARMTFIRESSSKMYGSIVFAIGQLIAETPYSILCAIAFWIIWYYPIGFQYASSRAGYSLFMILVVEMWAVTLGQAVAALSPSFLVAAYINPFLLIITTLFCGVTVPYPQIPRFYRVWLYELNPLTRLVGGLVVNEFYELPIVCTDREYNLIVPPTGQTCEAYLAPFIAEVGGYVNNPTATDSCQYCQYRTGSEFYGPLNLEYGNKWRDLGILIAFTIFNAIVTLIAARLLTLRYRKR